MIPLAEARLATIGDGQGQGNASAGGDDVARRSAQVMDALRRVVRRLHDGEMETEAALGVTTAQLFVLREVAKAEPLTIGTLARATATSQSSVSEVVARLVARKLLTRRRASADRRRAEIRLSSSGRELLSRGTETIQEQLIAAYQRMPATTQRALCEAFNDWVAEAGLSDIRPSMFFESSNEPSADVIRISGISNEDCSHDES